MIITKCAFNPVCDLAAVEPSGYVDLCQANAMNSLPANIASDDLSYNEIDDPRSIGFRPSDIFEAAQASKATLDYVPPKSE